jgi:hypothetical protein
MIKYKVMKRGIFSIGLVLIVVMVLCSFHFIELANAYYGPSQWSSFGSYSNNPYSYGPSQWSSFGSYSNNPYSYGPSQWSSFGSYSNNPYSYGPNNVGFANSYSGPYNYAWSSNYNVPSVYSWSYSSNSYDSWLNSYNWPYNWYGNTLTSVSLYAGVVPPPQNIDSVNGNNPAPAPGLYTQGSLGNVSTYESYHTGPAPDHNGTVDSINTPGMAYSYVSMDLSKLRDESDVIIRGRVKESLPSYKGKITCIIDEIGNKVGYNEEAAEAYEKGSDMVFIVRDKEAADKITAEYEKEEGLIYTDKVIQVSKYYKNNLGLDEIVIREAQGSSKTPLNSGDEVILFLKRLNPNKYIIFSGPQGTYHVSDENAVNEIPEKTMDLDELEAKLLL